MGRRERPGGTRVGRDGDPAPLGRLLERMVEQRGWRERVAGGKLRLDWASIVGEQIAAHSEPLRVDGGVLVVRADPGAWSTELTLMGKALAKRVDEALGGGVVTGVKVIAGTARPAG